jgi:hypothetical protein
VTRWPRAGQSGGKTAACAAGAACRVSVADLWCLCGCGPACAGRASPRLSPALTPGRGAAALMTPAPLSILTNEWVFREVGRSVRTVALLRYLADPRRGAKVDHRRDSNEHRTSAPCCSPRGDNVA